MTGLLRLLPLLLLLLLLLKDEHRVQSQRRGATGVVTHYGNCNSIFGRGRCIAANQCDFYDVSVLDPATNPQCSSQERPDLICCPREQNALPVLSARISNKTTTTTAAPYRKPGPPTTPDELPEYPYCGISFAFKVYGGSFTRITEFPWTTLLEYTTLKTQKKDYICGAAFIAQRWLITAGHCAHSHFVGPGRRLTGARLGEWNQTTNPDCIVTTSGKTDCAPPFIQATIDKILVHPQFDLGNLTHDIALLRLVQPVDWTKPAARHVEAVCLPPKRGRQADQLVGSAVDVSGWGRTENDYELSDVKRKAMLHVQPLDQCQEAYRSQGYTLGEGQLCATGGKGVDSCSGDSGGPLTAEGTTRQRDRYDYLAGVVSYGKTECGKTDFPGVYTRISHYMDWIEETIRENRGR